uniref:Ig-like domain-containing protein n=1 Tax=Azonexus sp. TaxID=1872668 RepID=UPI0027B89D7E
VVQSSETGTAYLVKDTITVSNLASITGAADNQFNSVTISAAGTNTNLPATGLVDGSYKVYAVDAAGNLSAAAANLVTIDGSAPTASVTTASLQPSGNAVVQSSETGTAYLVKDTITVSNLASITGAADNQFNSVTISAAGTNTNLPATGLVDGTYKVYAVDAAGNLSAASANTVTIDTSAPTRQSSTPADNALAVAVGANITLTFSEPMLAASGNLLIKKASDDSVVASIAIGDASQITISGSTVTINPTNDLAAGVTYYVELASGVLTDQAGNAYAGISDKTTLNFTTSPANVLFPVASTQGAANGLTFGFLDVNGNGAVNTDYTGNNADDRVTWTEFDTLDQAAPAWRMATKQELIDLYADPLISNPPTGWSASYGLYWSSDLSGGNHWGVDLIGGGSDASAGLDIYAAVVLVEPDTTAPTLQSSTPADNALAVAVGADITLTFSEAMKAATGNLLIKKTSDDSTVATIAIGDTSQITVSGSTVTINPTNDLAAGVTYYVELASGVLTDLAGNAYAGISDKTTLNFTTGSSVLFPVTSTNGAANGLTFGFLDLNGSGTVDTAYGGSGSTTDDYVTWTEFDILDQAAPAWRMATKQELLDLYADPTIANPPAGWADTDYYWSSDPAGAGDHWIVFLTAGYTNDNYDGDGRYAAVVLVG